MKLLFLFLEQEMDILRPYISLYILKMMYYTLFHSVISYGLISWGNSSFADTVFKLQKRVVRITMGRGTGSHVEVSVRN
jgi:hypothetical protein